MNAFQNRIFVLSLIIFLAFTNVLAQTGSAKNEQEAAQKLINAWKSGQRSAALKVAAPAAVKKLFRLKVYAAKSEPQPEVRCENEKSVKCFYGFMDEQGFSVQMSFAKRGNNYYVSAVETFVD